MLNDDRKKKIYKSKNNEEAKEIINILFKQYPDATCSLDFKEPIHLVVALILAAQCTDERVNKTLPVLFDKYPDVYALSTASVDDIAKIVKPCGFYVNKSNAIYKTANIIVNDFNGKVPDTMEKLCTFSGIGRKSSNIILQECFGKVVGIAVDTHVTRISRKIGFSDSKTPENIEKDLTTIFDKKWWDKINHIMVYHGRAICIARRPQCDICPINGLCSKND